MGVSPPSRVIRYRFSNKYERFSMPRKLMPRGYLSTHEKLHFLHYSVREVIYALIDVLGHFSVINEP